MDSHYHHHDKDHDKVSDQQPLPDFSSNHLDDAEAIDLSKLLKQINQSPTASRDPLTWESVAKIAVTKRDLEIGLYCVAKLKMARVARDVRNECSSNGTPAALASLAMNLGFVQEAETILIESGDKVCLSNFYQSTNQWDKAIECIDPLNFKNVCYKYAKYLESENRFSEAIKYYELSNTHNFEVPRMLFDLDDGNQSLYKYCMSSKEKTNHDDDDVKSGYKDAAPQQQQQQQPSTPMNRRDIDKKELKRWWAQYSESIGDVSSAIVSYQMARDYYNHVRLLCFTGEIEKAKSVVSPNKKRQSQKVTSAGFRHQGHEVEKEEEDDDEDYDDDDDGDGDEDDEENQSLNAARLFLAKQLEQSNPVEAVEYYITCKAFASAMRVYRFNQMIDELAKITVQYGSQEDAEDLIAEYESQDNSQPTITPESLVRLYQKSGQTSRAIAIALDHRSWIQLREVVAQQLEQQQQQQQNPGDGESMKESKILDDETIRKALEALRDDAEIIDIVIDLLLLMGDDDHIGLIEKLLMEFNIEISEDLIEKIDKISKCRQQQQQQQSGGSIEKNQGMIVVLADMALRQGKYLIAAKLFNSIGDRIASLKSLIRHGETDKIINYANIARDKAVYKIAANYLQTIDHPDRNVISNFYRKAGAMEELGRFNHQS